MSEADYLYDYGIFDRISEAHKPEGFCGTCKHVEGIINGKFDNMTCPKQKDLHVSNRGYCNQYKVISDKTFYKRIGSENPYENFDMSGFSTSPKD